MNPQTLNALLEGLNWYLCLVIIITVHEFGHAVAAVRLGDDTPRLQGRVTLNPIAHMDPIGTVALPLIAILLPLTGAMGAVASGFIIGWGRPVEFNLYNLRNRTWGPLVIAMAGPLMNVVLTVIVVTLMHFGALIGSFELIKFFDRLAQISMLLFFFNLLPIPPLDGSYILKQLTGMSWEAFRAFSRIGLIILIVVIQFQEVQKFLNDSTVKSVTLIERLVGVSREK